MSGIAPMKKKLMLRMAAKDKPKHKDSFSACRLRRALEFNYDLFILVLR